MCIRDRYYGLLQTYGRRVEKDVWSTENPNGKFPQPRSGGVTTTDYSACLLYTSLFQVQLLPDII